MKAFTMAVHGIVSGDWKVDANGILRMPGGPGLGIALDMDAVEQHTGNASRTDRNDGGVQDDVAFDRPGTTSICSMGSAAGM